jgi:hypothetical protein
VVSSGLENPFDQDLIGEIVFYVENPNHFGTQLGALVSDLAKATELSFGIGGAQMAFERSSWINRRIRQPRATALFDTHEDCFCHTAADDLRSTRDLQGHWTIEWCDISHQDRRPWHQAQFG